MENTIVIRLARADDAAAIAEIYRPIVEDTIISFEEAAPTVAQTRDRIATIQRRWPWLVAEAKAEVLGFVYASEHRTRAGYRWSVDVTAYVRADARGRRIGARLYNALFGLLERQRYHRAFAGITLPNAASVALHRSVGFTALGLYREVGYKLGAWHDVSWWERPIGPAGPPAGDPLPLAAIETETYLASLG